MRKTLLDFGLQNHALLFTAFNFLIVGKGGFNRIDSHFCVDTRVLRLWRTKNGKLKTTRNYEMLRLFTFQRFLDFIDKIAERINREQSAEIAVDAMISNLPPIRKRENDDMTT